MSGSPPPSGCLGFLARLGVEVEARSERVLEEYEADLYLAGVVDRSRKAAEIEYSRFERGAELEVEIKRRAGIPAGDQVAVRVLGVEVCSVTVADRLKSEVRLRTDRGDEVPPIKLGDTVELVHRGEVIAVGVFVRDD